MIRIRTLELNCWHDEKFEIRNISGSIGYLLLFIKTKAVFRLDGKASPVDGYITVEAKSDQATINMAYIIISKVPAPAAEAPADNTEATEPETEPAPAAETEQTGTAPEAAETANVPETGITLALIPAAVALAAVVVSKKDNSIYFS